MVSKSRKNFCFKTHTYFVHLLQKKRVAMPGRVYHVKLACLVCLKVKMGFRMCLSGLGPITGDEQGVGG